jgi:hypothetical protein
MPPTTPADFRIVVHGIEAPDYFQGHGIAFTKWADCATGIGDTLIDALNDALESLAQNGWEVAPIEAHETYREIAAYSPKGGTAPEDMFFYVSIDVKG